MFACLGKYYKHERFRRLRANGSTRNSSPASAGEEPHFVAGQPPYRTSCGLVKEPAFGMIASASVPSHCSASAE